MRFVYQYKTSDGERHEGEISVASREAVFTELKNRGIRPYGVQLAPGMGNWIASLGKRVYLIVVLSVLLAASVGLLFVLQARVKVQQEKVKAVEAALAPLQQERRSQIYGDPLLLQQCESKMWTNVFTNELDQLLAMYAIPAKAVDVDEARELARRVARPVVIDEVEVLESDGAEISKMKRMVNWMKGEFSAYIQAGGTFESYCERLNQRQSEEIRMRERIANELEHLDRGSRYETECEARNDILRTMGIRPVLAEELKFKNSPLTQGSEK